MSDNAASSELKAPPVVRMRNPSCNVCRLRKLKCVTKPGATSCDRCQRLKFDCVLHKRKPRGPNKASLEQTSEQNQEAEIFNKVLSQAAHSSTDQIPTAVSTTPPTVLTPIDPQHLVLTSAASSSSSDPSPLQAQDTLDPESTFFIAFVRLSGNNNQPLAELLQQMTDQGNGVLNHVITQYNVPVAGRFVSARVQCATDAICPKIRGNSPADWIALLRILDNLLAMTTPPKVVFVSHSISGICVSFEGWRGFLAKYVRPLNIELALVVRDTFPAAPNRNLGIQPNWNGFVQLWAGVKMARYDLTRVLEEGVQHSQQELQLRI